MISQIHAGGSSIRPATTAIIAIFDERSAGVIALAGLSASSSPTTTANTLIRRQEVDAIDSRPLVGLTLLPRESLPTIDAGASTMNEHCDPVKKKLEIE
jgi:hypothetical protein